MEFANTKLYEINLYIKEPIIYIATGGISSNDKIALENIVRKINSLTNNKCNYNYHYS